MNEIYNVNDADFSVTPDQIVSALIGAEFLMMKGFGGQSAQTLQILSLPTVRSFEPSEPIVAVQNLNRLRKWLVLCAALAILACSNFFTYLTSSASKQSVVAELAPWSLATVQEGGITIKMGTAMLSVPIGARLPNGEILRSIDAAHQGYATDSEMVTKK